MRVVIAGNSLNETTRDKEDHGKAKYLTKVRHILSNRVAKDSLPGRLIDSKIMVEWKIMAVILRHDHDVVVD